MHYSYALNPYALTEAAEWIIDNLRSQFNGYHYILGYTGMSGISIATTVAIQMSHQGLDFSMFYVRKRGELSHGCRTEFNVRISDVIHNADVKYVFVFVDDFIASGATRDRVYEAFINEFEHTRDIIRTCALTGSGNEIAMFKPHERFDAFQRDVWRIELLNTTAVDAMTKFEESFF